MDRLPEDTSEIIDYQLGCLDRAFRREADLMFDGLRRAYAQGGARRAGQEQKIILHHCGFWGNEIITFQWRIQRLDPRDQPSLKDKLSPISDHFDFVYKSFKNLSYDESDRSDPFQPLRELREQARIQEREDLVDFNERIDEINGRRRENGIRYNSDLRRIYGRSFR